MPQGREYYGPLPFGELAQGKSAEELTLILHDLQHFAKTRGAKFIQELFAIGGYNALEELRPMMINQSNMAGANRLNGKLDVFSSGQHDVFGLIPAIEHQIQYLTENQDANSPTETRV